MSYDIQTITIDTHKLSKNIFNQLPLVDFNMDMSGKFLGKVNYPKNLPKSWHKNSGGYASHVLIERKGNLYRSIVCEVAPEDYTEAFDMSLEGAVAKQEYKDSDAEKRDVNLFIDAAQAQGKFLDSLPQIFLID